LRWQIINTKCQIVLSLFCQAGIVWSVWFISSLDICVENPVDVESAGFSCFSLIKNANAKYKLRSRVHSSANLLSNVREREIKSELDGYYIVEWIEEPISSLFDLRGH